jgi:hypothetical protein
MDEPARQSGGWLQALVFALAAGVAIQVARLAARFPEEQPGWRFRNISLFVLPFVAGYFARGRQLDTRQWVVTAAPLVLVALVCGTPIPGAGHLPQVEAPDRFNAAVTSCVTTAMP